MVIGEPDGGFGAQAVQQVPATTERLRPAVVQVLVWVMVCWGAYAHAASGGGDRAMAASGSRRIMPPQWAQVRGAAVPVA